MLCLYISLSLSLKLISSIRSLTLFFFISERFIFSPSEIFHSYQETSLPFLSMIILVFIQKRGRHTWSNFSIRYFIIWLNLKNESMVVWNHPVRIFLFLIVACLVHDAVRRRDIWPSLPASLMAIMATILTLKCILTCASRCIA